MDDQTASEPPVWGPTFEHFVAYLRVSDCPPAVLSPNRYCEALDIDLQTLAEQAHVHRSTLGSVPGSQDIQNFLREALRVIEVASDVSGDLHKALRWYRHEPLSVFDHNTPELVVCKGRTDALLRYIASLSAGATG